MQTIDTVQLNRMLNSKEKFALINVLPEENYRQAHIPGSRNIPFEQDDFLERVEEVVDDKETRVVVYCASTDSDTSPRAAEKLEAAGFTNVYDYAAGTKAWKEAGQPVEEGA